MTTGSWVLPFCSQQHASMILWNKASVCSKSSKCNSSQPFSALHHPAVTILADWVLKSFICRSVFLLVIGKEQINIVRLGVKSQLSVCLLFIGKEQINMVWLGSKNLLSVCLSVCSSLVKNKLTWLGWVLKVSYLSVCLLFIVKEWINMALLGVKSQLSFFPLFTGEEQINMTVPWAAQIQSKQKSTSFVSVLVEKIQNEAWKYLPILHVFSPTCIFSSVPI